jgi:curved DNA-binding protein CbpA
MDHYQCLGLELGASVDDIKRAYRNLALQNHPDKTLLFGYDERREREAAFKEASAAYEVLTDAKKKADYDVTLSRQRSRLPRSAQFQAHYAAWEANKAKRRSENRKARKQRKREQQERQQWNGYGDTSNAFPAIKSEDIHMQSHLSCMRPAVEREFGEWKYEFRLSNEFEMRPTTEPGEWYGTGEAPQNELYIRLKLNKHDVEKATEDIYIAILKAPGVVDHFETYFKERDERTCFLTMVLHVYPYPVGARLFMPLPIELPINLRLRENWAPFSGPMNIVVRTTHLRFYSQRISVPKEKELRAVEDEEMVGAEKVDAREEYRRTMSYERRAWQRVAEFSFVRDV